MKGQPDPELYLVKKEQLLLLEQQSQESKIDLFYGDESGFSQLGYEGMSLMDGNSTMKRLVLVPFMVNKSIALDYYHVKMNLSLRPLQNLSILIL